MGEQGCMVQDIVRAYPPIMDKIAAAFPEARGQGVIFSWGPTLFAPTSPEVLPALRVHEAVHGARQAAYVDPVDGERGVAAWWARYIADAKFRLDEEIPAHAAEYAWHLAQPDANKAYAGWRYRHQFHKHQIALRLSGPLYGKLISLGEAKRLIAD